MNLTEFFTKASLEKYAGGKGETDSQRHGFKELEYKESDWYYRDSYTGFFRSWGQTVIYEKDQPVWIHLYGGGMEPEHKDDKDFAIQTFLFLKKALTEGLKQKGFRPRGPDDFKYDKWEYACAWEGTIEKFFGSEKISFKGKVVFTHDFLGGLIV